ncbi:hypothetical protein KGA65_03730 [Ideonella sp. B7]|uniref:sensor histidine kinase n=1 Tax=Ideonella benzenivorans TaxID=2831643 RepID=UPI001CED837C|nr:ATP-binding protein [Ideonella benzenivorans]MCA6215649.1 hypothetical protein [Ideonella benzenivorans]
MRQLLLCGCLLVLSVLFPGGVAAQPVLNLSSSDQAPIALAPQGLLYVDPTASPDPQTLFAQGGPTFQPATAAALAPGYSASAFWLRWVLHNPEDQRQVHILVLEPARMESVALFWRRVGEGGWQHARAGTDQPFSAREIRTRASAFAIRLAPGETREVLLRVASRGAVSLRPTLWRPTQLLIASTWDSWVESLMLSLPLMLALLAGGLYLAQRQPVFGLLAVYLLLALLYEAAMRGAAFALLWPDATDWAQRSLGVLGTAATVAQALTMRQVLGGRQRQPRLDRVLLGVMALSGLVGGWCLWGDYRQATQWNGRVLPLLIATTLLVSVRGLKTGGALGPAWLFAMFCQQLGLLPRYLALLGVMPSTALIENSPLVGTLVGSITMMGAALYQLGRERAQQAQRLEATVRQRTAELVDANARARASDVAKGRLLGYIGHDLRGPLASMVTLTRRLGQGPAFEADRRAIEQSGQMLLETIDDLQRFARSPEAGATPEIIPAPLCLHGLLIEVVEQAQAMALSGGNALQLVRGPGLPGVVELDARHLRQVLFNLLSNAAKFTRNGRIELVAQAVDGLLRLEVIDTGRGIAEADLPLVFEPFVRAASQGRLPGLGLGLSIARQAVRAMGGRISVRSQLGMGSRFRVELPCLVASEDQVQWPLPEAEPGAGRLGQGRRALVLDACATARAALAERLALAGFDRILEAASLDEARALMATAPEALPLLLVLEPQTVPVEVAVPALRRWLGEAPATLRCTVQPEGPEEVAKPAPSTQWWAALQCVLAGRDPGV